MTNKKSSPFKLIVIVTILVFALITAAVLLMDSNSEDNGKAELGKQPPIEGQPTIGSEEAPVSVVEFGDYKCPACKAWGEQFFPHLVEEYVANGDVKFTYINVLFHGEESELGSLAAEAVYKQNPESYWEFHKKLFDQQPDSNDHDSVWLTMDTIVAVAGTIPSIDLNLLQEDMQSQSIKEEVSKDSALTDEFNVEKTPTVIVNGTMLENPFDYEKIILLIEQELEGKE